MNALLDTGANCNLISIRFKHLFQISETSNRRIRFATAANSQMASVCVLSSRIESNGIPLEFNSEFFILI
jgi:hypothetical protein